MPCKELQIASFLVSSRAFHVVITWVSLILGLFQNAAVFWYNLLPNGDPDLLTRHAGCPVLAGKEIDNFNLQFAFTRR